MNTDCGVNVVVFEILIGHRPQLLLGECSTRDSDGLRKVWGELVTSFNLCPADVCQVYSQWKPTPDDQAFLATAFPVAVTVSFSFHRPSARRDWGKPTPEFAQAADEFERSYGDRERATSTLFTEFGPRTQQPWWRYWDKPDEGTNPFASEPQ